MKDTIKRMRPEDFIINVRPDLNDVREALEKKADEYEGLLNPPSKKGKVVDKHDNVVVLSFEPDAKDKTQ